LGTREKNVDGSFGPYRWQTYGEVDTNKANLARGLAMLDLCPEIEGGFKFCGIWSKNRWEWMTTLLACMHYKITVVGFYDAMGTSSVEFILNQTEMTSIICSGDYIEKIVNMKKDGMAQHIKNLVTIDEIKNEVIQLASENDIKIHTFAEVMKLGEETAAAGKAPEFIEPTPDDYYMFSYTSGTTGDSKGVMLTHNNILSQAWCSLPRTNLVRGDCQISYLPYPHSYE
jgi:long-chain acyl-CoA synthetase